RWGTLAGRAPKQICGRALRLATLVRWRGLAQANAAPWVVVFSGHQRNALQWPYLIRLLAALVTALRDGYGEREPSLASLMRCETSSYVRRRIGVQTFTRRTLRWHFRSCVCRRSRRRSAPIARDPGPRRRRACRDRRGARRYRRES